MTAKPNPQGKGLVPTLAVLAAGKAATVNVPPKRVERVSAELFTSLFVLESDFSFQPIPGRAYSLYQKNERFWLSQIGPEEWNSSLPGRFVGTCELQEDMTWTLELSEEAGADDALMSAIREKHEALDEQIRTAGTLEDILPRYSESLPFYQRAFSYALAHSLRTSMERAGIASLSYDDARALPLPAK